MFIHVLLTKASGVDVFGQVHIELPHHPLFFATRIFPAEIDDDFQREAWILESIPTLLFIAKNVNEEIVFGICPTAQCVIVRRLWVTFLHNALQLRRVARASLLFLYLLLFRSDDGSVL